LSPLCLPAIPDKVSPVYYEEEDDEIAGPSLLDDYVLMDLEHGPPILPETFDEVTEVPSIIPVSSSPSPSSIMETRRGEGMVLNSSLTAESRSLSPPPKATVAAGREGWMEVSNLFQLSSARLISDDYTPTEEVVSLAPLQLTVAAWW